MELFESDDVRTLAIMDDYQWWSGHGEAASAGKPLWFAPHRAFDGGEGEEGGSRRGVHPIFFDDNIKNNAHQSIVSVRASGARGAPFEALNGEAIRRLEGIVLVRCATCDAVLDHDWFLKKIADAERRLDEDFSTAADQSAILQARMPPRKL